MAQSKNSDIDKYLRKELKYLEELINKSQVKQKAENSRFSHQCQQVKLIANELDDERMILVKRVINVEDHLGIETGAFENEQHSLSGNHADLAQGQFDLQRSFLSLQNAGLDNQPASAATLPGQQA